MGQRKIAMTQKYYQMKSKNILITGNTSGLGLALNKLLIKNNTIYSISKSKLEKNIKNKIHITSNFNDLKKLKNDLKKFSKIKKIDYIFLNAGILGDLNFAKNLNINKLIEAININVLANKILIDFFLKKKIIIKNIIAISSGAAINGKEGWLLYSTTKSMLKMLIEVYSLENKKINFCNLAPGLVKTKMQRKIFLNKKKIKSLNLFKELYKNNLIEEPNVVAKKIIDYLNNSNNKRKIYFDLRNYKF